MPLSLKTMEFQSKGDKRRFRMVQVYRILTLVDARISHFLTQGIIFTFFFQGNWIPFLFISRSSSFPVIQVIVDIKI